MKKLLLISLLCSQYALAQSGKPVFVTDSIDKYVDRGMQGWQIPAVSVCIVKDGQVVFAKGYGVKRVATNERVDENTLFMIGSNTKAFTATALAQLASQGKLSLDDKVVKWWPEFKVHDPWITKEMNIRDLLSHRMGYETFQGDFMFFDSDLQAAQVFEKFGKLKPMHGFRSRWGYTNAGFAAAGEVIHKVSGKTWEQYLEEEIIAPLGMERTTATVFDLRMASNIAFPHSIHDGKTAMVAFGNLGGMAPAGSMSSSAVDISRWMLAQLDSGRLDGKQVIPWNAIATTWEPHSILGSGGPMFNTGHFSLYGLGWFLEEYSGKKIVSHTGGVNGYVTSVTLLPEEKLGIAVFTNTDQNHFYEDLKWEIIDAYLGLPYRDYSGHFLKMHSQYQSQLATEMKLKRDTISMNPQTTVPLSAYAGKYEHDIYGKMVMKVEGRALKAKFENHSSKDLTLEPLGGNRFVSTWNDPLYGNRVLTFTTENGKVKSLLFRVAGFIEYTSYEFKKTD
jgi:CubicO group peptidase (beta-lactamase class C family)